MEDTASFIALYLRFGKHRQHFVHALHAFENDSMRALQASPDELKQLGLPPQVIKTFKAGDSRYLDPCLRWLEDPAHHLVTFSNAEYPDLLREIPDFPPLLFAVGNIDLLSAPQIAVVGSRLCSTAGIRHAGNFAETLSGYGFTITSGLAQGIDAAAHEGALHSGGTTIAVLGTGCDTIYPAHHQALAERIVASGLLVSEFLPGMPPAKHHFPQRNRIISGLSIATLVVEASLRSGSLITARLASEQGRDVFAIPGSIHNPQSRGCHHLIRNGAILAETAAQVAEDLGNMVGYLRAQEPASTSATPELDRTEASLLKYIEFDPVTIDSLCERSGLTIDKLSSILLSLELKRIIESVPGGRIVRI